MAKAKSPIPEGFHTVTPQLTLDNAAQAIDWYKKGLGAEELSRAVGPDGKIMHAELRIGNSKFMVNDPMMGGKGPKAFGGSPASLWVYVEDCDTLFNRAIKAGAKGVGGQMGAGGHRARRRSRAGTAVRAARRRTVRCRARRRRGPCGSGVDRRPRGQPSVRPCRRCHRVRTGTP